MANEEQAAVLIGGADSWNLWRRHHSETLPDLSHSIFSGESLVGVNLSRANLRGADLSRADLTRGNLSQADLRDSELSGSVLVAARLPGAQLEHVKLRGANLALADLSAANLDSVDLRNANLSSASLGDVNLANARLGMTILGNVDLSTARGLETVIHDGPSVVGIDTVFRSKGAIPDAFLRGVGVPETFLSYLASLVNKSLHYSSCFISYSSMDRIFIDRLHNDLQRQGVRCWFAPKNMRTGDPLRVRIDESIRIHDKLLVVLSVHSVTSKWVEAEVETALEHERRCGKTVVFPIRLDDAVMEIDTGWPALIHNTRHIGDFTQWQDHAGYQAAFERLLWDLRAEGG